jgi:hypothetical protein
MRIDQSRDRQLTISIDPLSIRWYLVPVAFITSEDRLDLIAIDDYGSLLVQ